MWASYFVRNGNKLSISSWLATEVQVCWNVGRPNPRLPNLVYFNSFFFNCIYANPLYFVVVPRIPFDLLDSTEAETVYRNYVNALRAEIEMREWVLRYFTFWEDSLFFRNILETVKICFVLKGLVWRPKGTSMHWWQRLKWESEYGIFHVLVGLLVKTCFFL